MIIRNFSPYIKIITAMSLIGTFIALNKIASAKMPIFLFSELRLGIASLIFIFLLVKQEKSFSIPKKNDAKIFFIQALLGVFLFSIFLLYGTKFTSALESGLITSLTPAFVSIVSIFLLKERLNINQTVGIVIALIGTIIINIFGATTNSSWSTSSLLGNFLILLAVFGESIFITFGKLVSKNHSPLETSAFVVIIGAVLFLPLAIKDALTYDFTSIDWKVLILVLYSAVIVTVVAVILMNQAVIELPGGSTAVFTAFMPISAIVFAYFILGEKIYWYHLIGATCVLLSITLISLNPSKKKKDIEKPPLEGY
ncbi:DMT family transporter [Bacillus sp. CGMCC 1.16607]|uniref:DMT family transporter n=1 Tax=Bacillus sp. CGMCC 1.16607 TaxID=3351842 RepID=UPI00364505FB